MENRDISFLFRKPLLEISDTTPDIFKRALNLVHLVLEKYKDCVKGIWLLKNSIYTETTLFVYSTLEQGSERDIALFSDIGELFSEKGEPDNYILFDYNNDVVNSSDHNYEILRSMLDNAFVIYEKE